MPRWGAQVQEAPVQTLVDAGLFVDRRGVSARLVTSIDFGMISKPLRLTTWLSTTVPVTLTADSIGIVCSISSSKALPPSGRLWVTCTMPV
jgi:hypothetical protein